MGENVYKVIELVGTSKESWEKAATAAVNRLRDLRVAEIVQLDMQILSRQGGSLSREGKALLQVRRLGRRSLGFFWFARNELHAEATASTGRCET